MATAHRDIEFNDECFVEMGTAFEQQGYVKVSLVGSATTRLFAVKAAVDACRELVDR